jgi:hypothetical protein
MPDIQITTDGTITSTKLIVDGKDITKKEKVVSISLFASAPYKSKYSGEVMQGYAACSYEVVGEDGKMERKSYGTTDTPYSAGIGQKVQSEDSVIRFLGQDADKEVSDLVDKIISHCEGAKTKCASREVLLSRSLASLKDKAEDLGISLEENTDSK